MQQALTYSAFIGMILPFLAALIMRASWSANAKRALIIGLAIIAIMAGIFFEYKPGAWLLIVPMILSAIGSAQVVYSILKPTGALDWLTVKTELPKRALPEDQV